MDQLRVVSFGGGVQSTALLVLAAQGKIDFKTFLFSNVGEDSEHPKTLEYVRNVSMPYAEDHGLRLIELHKVMRNGDKETLVDRLVRSKRSITIPARAGVTPLRRNCTVDFKINVVRKWIKKNGATADNPALIALGISTDEFQRARTPYDPRTPEQRRIYPLIDMRISRSDCNTIIESAGLPIPPKSSCFFCPFHDIAEWTRLRRDEPELFEKAEEIEHLLHNRSIEIGMQKEVFLTKYKMLLADAIPLEPVTPNEDDEVPCDSGYCMT